MKHESEPNGAYRPPSDADAWAVVTAAHEAVAEIGADPRDASAWQRVATALRESDERYRAALEGSLDAFVVLGAIRDAAGTIVDFEFVDLNSRGEQLLRGTRARIVGRALCEWLPSFRSSGFLERFVQVVETGQALEDELQVRRAEIAADWLMLQAIPLGDGVAVTARDISLRRASEAALREAEQQYRALVEHVPVVVYLQAFDDAASTLYMSPQVTELVGYTPEEWLAEPDLWLRLIHPDDRERVLAEHLRTNATGEPFRMEYRLIARDGRVVWVRDEGVLIRREDGEPRYWQGVFLDITERRAAEEALRESEERFRSFVQHAADVITLTDAHGVIRYESPAIAAVLGLDAAQTPGQHLFAPVDASDRSRAEAWLAEVASRPGAHSTIELRFEHADGSPRWLEMRATNLLADPVVAGIVFNSRDATDRHLFEEQLAHQAFYDALTGLPNRSLLMDRLEHALARRARAGGQLAVVFLDLDRFKVINDSLGHAAGDRLLVALGQRLLASVRAIDTVARLGGDEFIVLIEEAAGSEEALAVAQRLLDALHHPFELDDCEAFVSASVGIALSDAESDAGALMRNADIALYRAKGAGRSQCVVYEPSMNVFSVERLALESDLRRAIARDELRLHYQPEIDLASGRIAGVEALVRWEHPQRGYIAPGDFIPLAEETGLIAPIGFWVLREACRQARAWHDRFPELAPVVMSVNLSARQFQQDDLVAQVTEVLAETGMPPELLRLEITESVVVQEAGSARETLQALRALGVRIAIDDFGIGYSSLAYLTRLFADTLKVDRSFVSGIGRDERALSIVGAVASLAHALGMDVTAEGIETSDQLDHIRLTGCDRGQGFHFARPLPADELQALLLAARPLGGHA